MTYHQDKTFQESYLFGCVSFVLIVTFAEDKSLYLMFKVESNVLKEKNIFIK